MSDIKQPTRMAYNIGQFCKLHGVSEPFYYKLRKQGLAPQEIRLGRLRLITVEEAARWRPKHTAASAAA
jgi:hypothetical protein